MTETGTETWHGTSGGYTNHGCKCDRCKAAIRRAAYIQRQSRKRRLAADPTLAPHGVTSTYSNWCCRCDDCRKAWAAEQFKQYGKTKKVSP